MLKKEDITNGSAGQALIKAAGSVYDVSNNSISQKSELSTTSEKKVFEGKASREVESKYSDYNKPITISDVETLRSIGRKSINNFTEDDTKKPKSGLTNSTKSLALSRRSSARGLEIGEHMMKHHLKS